MTLGAVAKGLFSALILPIALPGAAISALIGGKSKTTPEEIAETLRNFLHGGGSVWDWDDFTSIPIEDPRLETIRQRAAAIDLPADDESLKVLDGLLIEAEALCAAR